MPKTLEAKMKLGEGTFWGEMFSLGMYKRNQGRRSRQLTMAALALVAGIGAYRLSGTILSSYQTAYKVGIPTLLFAAGAWFAFRLVNYPRFAEFLISVEGEMAKVSWPSWQELRRSTVVVLSSMVFLGVVLFAYDVFWQELLNYIGVLQFKN